MSMRTLIVCLSIDLAAIEYLNNTYGTPIPHVYLYIRRTVLYCMVTSLVRQHVSASLLLRVGFTSTRLSDADSGSLVPKGISE